MHAMTAIETLPWCCGHTQGMEEGTVRLSSHGLAAIDPAAFPLGAAAPPAAVAIGSLDRADLAS